MSVHNVRFTHKFMINKIGIRELTPFGSALRLFLIVVIYISKLLTIKNFASLELEHYESDTEFIDRL